MGMTMKRDAKEAMLKRNIELLLGFEQILSPSPQRAREYGRYLPAAVAARIEMARARKIKGHVSREYIVSQKIKARRAAGRVRVA